MLVKCLVPCKTEDFYLSYIGYIRSKQHDCEGGEKEREVKSWGQEDDRGERDIMDVGKGIKYRQHVRCGERRNGDKKEIERIMEIRKNDKQWRERGKMMGFNRNIIGERCSNVTIINLNLYYSYHFMSILL